MMRTFQWISIAAVLMLATLAGCGDSTNAPAGVSGENSATVDTAPPPTVDMHAHPSEGPHHGDLVELGNEEFHAEIVHGENSEVAVYVLDSSATKAVPIEAAEVTINLTHDGMAEQFKLPAAADAGDPAGQSSRFSIKDEELAEDLDREGVDAKLVLNINGKQYSGKIQHHHGHDHGSHKH